MIGYGVHTGSLRTRQISHDGRSCRAMLSSRLMSVSGVCDMSDVSVEATSEQENLAARDWWRDWKRKPTMVAPILLLALIALILLRSGLNWEVLSSLVVARTSQLVQTGLPLALLAIGAGLVIATGQIDLSNTSLASLSGVVYALLTTHWGVQAGVAISIVLVIGLLVGYVNGYFVANWSAPSLIVTWAVGIVLSVACLWLAKAYVGSGSISSVPLGAFSDNFLQPSGYGFYLYTIIIGLLMIVLSKATFAKEAMAVGADAQSASYIGIRPRSIRRQCFILSGLLAAAGGIMYAYGLGSATTASLQNRTLDVVAIAVLGGTLLTGGYFSAISIVCATLFWQLLGLTVPAWDLLGVRGHPAESEINSVYFALVVLIAMLSFSRKISGNLRPVLTRENLGNN